MNQNEQKPPSIFKMMKTFTSELANYIKEGAPNVTADAYAKRLDICSQCEHFIERTMRCGECGCMLQHKAKWRTSDCPKKKWPKEKQPPVPPPQKSKDEER